MSYATSAPPDRDAASPASTSRCAVATIAMTIYGCERNEAALFEEMAPRFGVVPSITEAVVSDGNLELAHGSRCVSVGHKTRIGNPILRALSLAGVAHITTRSIGTDHLDMSYAESVGISVATASYSPHGVADHTLMLILMAVRGAKSTIRRADVHDYRLPEVPGRELRDLTIGVIGTGRIGAAVIERLRGFGCRVLAYDPRQDRSGERVSLDELVRRSDLVTLHAPLRADTHRLLDRRRIERMKRGAYVVNVGRGALLDTEALVCALESGRLGGAALDVLEGEEGVFYTDCRSRAIDNALLLRLGELPNVLITPHAAYYTDRALREIVESTLLDCVSFESGRRHG